VPATLAPGTYQLRLFANDGFTLLATSNNFSITSAENVFGKWSNVMSWPAVAINAHLLPTGKVMLWEEGPILWLWDPATGAISTPALPAYDLHCSGHAFLSDGRLLVAGGHIDVLVGFPNVSIYDPLGNSWTRLPDMNAGRWYPTATVLANGDVLVISGTIDLTTVNTLPQIWQTENGTWRNLTNAQADHGGLYPEMFLLPDGRVFKAGPRKGVKSALGSCLAQ
jgi:hypothetical protein